MLSSRGRVLAFVSLIVFAGWHLFVDATPTLAADPPPPTLTAVTPSSGPAAGGTTVTLTGSGFQAGAVVTFNTVPATDVDVVSSTELSAVTPPGAEGPATIVLQNPDGHGVSITAAFVYLGPVPTILGVSPDHGPSTGGTIVTVSGTSFRPGATVRFGETLATNVSVLNASTMTATTPAHAAGLVTVEVVNSDGQSGSRANAFTYDPAPPPVVSTVAPASGTTGGGTPVTISGTGFQSGATVRFGDSPATNVSVVSPTTITALTPSRGAGTVAVAVINPDNQSGTLANAFTYVTTAAPVVLGVSPRSGPLAGGNTVIISGAGFLPGARVLFGSNLATSVNVLNTTQISVVAPAASVGGSVNITVTNTDGRSHTLANAYTYASPPTIMSISPSSGTTGGGTPVTITGTNFATGATVRFGTSLATGVAVVHGTLITAITPARSAGTVTVQVTNPSGQSAQLNNAYTYVSTPAPIVLAVSPDSGPVTGGNVVTIAGSNFLPGARVAFGTRSATGVTVLGSTQLTATVPAGSAGVVSVRVTNTDGKSDTERNAYTYTRPPTITSITPTTGTTAGGTQVTINGANFVTGMTVLFGGLPATDVTFLSAAQVLARTPARSAGTVSVSVQTPAGAQATLANAYTYVAAAALSGVAPSTGPTTGGTSITISGSNFAAGATVTVGGIAATDVVVVSSTRITARTPAHPPGAAAVQVRSAENVLASGALTFTYVTLPGSFDRPVTIAGINPVIWNGGTTAQFEAAVSAAGARSATVFASGKPLVLIPNAPAFVNQAFRAAFPVSLPAGTIVLVLR